jgi:hypothetical protein
VQGIVLRKLLASVPADRSMIYSQWWPALMTSLASSSRQQFSSVHSTTTLNKKQHENGTGQAVRCIQQREERIKKGSKTLLHWTIKMLAPFRSIDHVIRSDLHARMLRARPHRLHLADVAAAAGHRRHALCSRRRRDRKRRLWRRRRRRLDEGGGSLASFWLQWYDGEVVAGADLDHEAVGVVEEELVDEDAALLHALLHELDLHLLEPPHHRVNALALHAGDPCRRQTYLACSSIMMMMPTKHSPVPHVYAVSCTSAFYC